LVPNELLVTFVSSQKSLVPQHETSPKKAKKAPVRRIQT